jgi:hypothetical protein
MDPIYYYLPDDQKINSYHLSRHIITLLNNQGGEIYVGMKDGDSISGVKNVKTKKVQIEAICKKCISPYPKKAVAVLYIRNLPLKHVILIRVIGDSGIYKYSPYRKERLQDTIAKTNNETEDDSDMFRPKDSFSTLGTVFVKYFETSTETSVPMFEALTLHGLNQLIGYIKYNNRLHFDILYRGEASLHKTYIPSLYRNYPNVVHANQKIASLIERIILDDKMKKQLHITNPQSERDRYIVESMLQHYGLSTHFLDVVDNHWVALWMGQHRWTLLNKQYAYATYRKREISYIDSLSKDSVPKDDLYQYILLFGIPRCSHRLEGFQKNKGFVTIDLREILPSMFVRPHAQHAMLVRKLQQDNTDTDKDFDMASNLACIIRIRIDRASEWLGDGKLLTLPNLFPSPANDQGYNILLHREDLFEGYGEQITQYVYE